MLRATTILVIDALGGLMFSLGSRAEDSEKML